MKKIITFLTAVLAGITAQAYYDDDLYGRQSSDGGTGVFIIILLIVGAIIQIVLICKFWAMANDVQSLKERFSDRNPSLDGCIIARLSGDTEGCYRGVLAGLYVSLCRYGNVLKELESRGFHAQSDSYKTYYEQYSETVKTDINAAKIKCKALGRELPPELQSFGAFMALRNSFESEDK